MASKNNSFITETADADVVLSVETEDLVTCSVCLYEYDQNIRQPKCIPCSHTFCSLCLEVIQLMQSHLFYTPENDSHYIILFFLFKVDPKGKLDPMSTVSSSAELFIHRRFAE